MGECQALPLVISSRIDPAEMTDNTKSFKAKLIDQTDNPFRALPSVDSLLGEFADTDIDLSVLTVLLRDELSRVRQDIESGEMVDRQMVVQRCVEAISALTSTRLGEVINGTGIVLHTNLGRAPVSAATAAAMAQAASSYLAIEIDPETNLRGGRMNEVSRLMNALTGAEATLVVNNNAAAVLLTLAAIATGREVIVSRGEAVEIGGGFRIPDVIAQSGCRLIEVGTTNRTYVSDYARAIGPDTAALLKVHASNFQIQGFTANAASSELGTLSRERTVPLIEDLGSGALLDTTQFGLRHEPTVREAIADGASVVTLSGDKLLGGPQAGIIAGQRGAIQRIERHPLARSVRADKVTLAGVTATLRHYLAGNARVEIPVWRMIGATVDELSIRARKIARQTGFAVVDSTASIGGGSLPGETMPSIALKFEVAHPDQVAQALRSGTPSVFPIIRDGAVLIDLRAVQPEQDGSLIQALRAALGASA